MGSLRLCCQAGDREFKSRRSRTENKTKLLSIKPSLNRGGFCFIYNHSLSDWGHKNGGHTFLEYGGIHNTPEQFFYKYKDISLLSENLFQTPGIIKNRVLQADVVKKMDLKKIFYNSSFWRKFPLSKSIFV